MKVELISIHNSQSPRTKDAQSVLRSLRMDDAFVIENENFVYKSKFACSYKIFDWFSKDGLIGVLHEFSCPALSLPNVQEEDIASFADLLRDFRRNLKDLQAKKIETLWDDIGRRYGQLAYPRIFTLENKLRSLITKFMVRNLGEEWVKSSPNEVVDEINKTRRTENGVDALHNVDFKTLGTFLTKKYSSIPQDILYDRINEIDHRLPHQELLKRMLLIKDGVPRSNWTRYFKEIVSCQDAEFKKKWDDLYDLRCKVAHNAFLTRPEFVEVVRLSDQLDKIIDEAIENIRQVHINRREAEFLADDLNRLVDASGGFENTSPDANFAFPPTAGEANLARIDLRRDYWSCIHMLIAFAEWAGLSQAIQGALAPRVAQKRLVDAGLLPEEIVNYLRGMSNSLNDPEWAFDKISFRRYKEELAKIKSLIAVRLQIIKERVVEKSNLPKSGEYE